MQWGDWGASSSTVTPSSTRSAEFGYDVGIVARMTCRHIRLSNPAGPGRPDVPRLLRAAADLLERIGDDIEVLDVTFRDEPHPDGDWTALNIYYRR